MDRSLWVATAALLLLEGLRLTSLRKPENDEGPRERSRPSAGRKASRLVAPASAARRRTAEAGTTSPAENPAPACAESAQARSTVTIAQRLHVSARRVRLGAGEWNE